MDLHTAAFSHSKDAKDFWSCATAKALKAGNKDVAIEDITLVPLILK